MASVRLGKGERKTQIVEVTLQLIAAHGVQGTSTKRIAAAAGVSEATLYKHFASRNEIFLAALDAVYWQVFEIIDSSSGADAPARLRDIAAGHLRRLSSQNAGFVFPLFEFVAAPPEAGLREPLGARQRQAAEAIAAIVRGGKDEGSVGDGVDPEQAAWCLVGVFWMRDVAYLMGLGDDVWQGSTALLETVLGSILAQSPEA